MTNRTMYDGINSDAAAIAGVFRPGDLIAGYDFGTYSWAAADWAHFVPSARVTITPYAGEKADVLDVETGDATPWQTRGWLKMMKDSGYWRPTIYCNLSTVADVRKGTGPYILAQDYDLWIADWDGTSVVPYPHAAAKQRLNTANWDVSVVFDDLWPRRSKPVPVPLTRTLASPETVLTVPAEADHVVIEAYAIVHSKPVLVRTWRVS